MIIVRLMGGLGNQMFEYAAGRALAEHRQAELKLDLGWFKTQSLRKYELGGFSMTPRFAGKMETKGNTRRFRVFSWLLRRRQMFRSAEKCTYFREKRFYEFDADFFSLGSDVYLDGYWQNEKYFTSSEPAIRKTFFMTGPFPFAQDELIKKMESTNSVSIHVRRGDFAAVDRTRAYHGLCSPDYYQRGVELMKSKIGSPRFFVFSDEPEWVKSHLPLPPETVFVTGGSVETPHHDLRLMASCRHHIIANSSFSWWGAWLCTNTDKMVIAPSRWVIAPGVNDSDACPREWMRI